MTNQLKQYMTESLNIGNDSRVIDIGCGPGIDTMKIAELVGKGGAVVGVDYDAEMIQEASAGMIGRQTESIVHFCEADAAALPFQDLSFDACRCERLLQHVPDPKQVILEIIRVVKSGGRLAVADTDWGTLSIDTPEVDIERRLARFRAGIYYNGYAGRQIFRLLKQHHATDLEVMVFPIVWTDYGIFRATNLALNNFESMAVASGTVNRKEMRRFIASLERAQARDVFFASGSLILVTGTRP